ncbi:MAG: cytochrome c [Desulfuromonadales bacterium]|nr:MAG: cytochrome c [Desulfuromonadales bacterium]
MHRPAVAAALVALIASATPLPSQAASQGEKLFKEKCAMCHAVKGAGGVLGPDLSTIGISRDERALFEQITNPGKKNPATTMPAFGKLPKADLDSLVAYLKGLR